MTDETQTEDKQLAPVFGTSLIDIGEGTALMKAMEETAEEGGRSGDVSYMSFSGKTGIYSIGIDKRYPEETEPFLVAIPSFELGYVCWKGGKPVAKRLAKITQPRVEAPDEEEFGPFDDRRGEGWYKARAITVRSLESGEQCYFSNNSKSGVANMSDLQREIMEKMKSGQPCWPVVTFTKSQFTAQNTTNWKPDINIIDWFSTEEVNKLADPDVDPMELLQPAETAPDPSEAPAPRRRKL